MVIINDLTLPKSCNDCPLYRGFSICLMGGFNEVTESANHRQPWCRLSDLVECADCVYNSKGTCRHPYLPPREVWDGDYCSYGERRGSR